MNLPQILQQSEGKTLEFKRDLSSPQAFLRSVVAFANTAGGRILIGVENGRRYISGIADPLAEEERVASLISDSVSPMLLPDIEILRHRSRNVISIWIYPSSNRPHFLGKDPSTGAYVRVGSTNRRADSDLLAEMRRHVRGESFDADPMPNLNSEDINFRVASELFAEYRKLTLRDLDTLRICTSYQGRTVPTVGGVLLFGSHRLTYFPDAWIQAGRFVGTDKSRILDRADFQMPLIEAIHAVFAFIERHMASGLEINGLRHNARWTVPPIAVREALVNAVAHADYSQRGSPFRVAIFDDRLEIENPGLLPFGLTINDLPRGVSKIRNRVITRVLHELRLVEQWGSGVQRMISACRETGLSSPVWEELGNRIRVTMSTKQSNQPVLDDTDRGILDALESHGGSRTSEVAKMIRLSPRATRTRLAKLVDLGLAVEIGSSPRDPQRKYYASIA